MFENRYDDFYLPIEVEKTYENCYKSTRKDEYISPTHTNTFTAQYTPRLRGH